MTSAPHISRKYFPTCHTSRRSSANRILSYMLGVALFAFVCRNLPGLPGRIRFSIWASVTGNEKVKQLPCPAMLRTQMVLPFASASRLLMARPGPVPPNRWVISALVCVNGKKTFLVSRLRRELPRRVNNNQNPSAVYSDLTPFGPLGVGTNVARSNCSFDDHLNPYCLRVKKHSRLYFRLRQFIWRQPTERRRCWHNSCKWISITLVIASDFTFTSCKGRRSCTLAVVSLGRFLWFC